MFMQGLMKAANQKNKEKKPKSTGKIKTDQYNQPQIEEQQKSQNSKSFANLQIQQKQKISQQPSQNQFTGLTKSQNEAGQKLKAGNIISRILDFQINQITKQKNLNPQFLRIKNNILLFILLLSSFGIYYLFQGFLDVMLLAFIGGVGYQQLRQRFMKFWSSNQPFFQKEMTLTVRIMSIIGYIFIVFILPWLRTILQHPSEVFNHLTLSDLIYAFSFKLNLVVLSLQIFLLLKILHLILAPKIFPIISKWAPKSQQFYKWMFGIAFYVVFIGAIILIPSGLVMQVSRGSIWIQQKIQSHFGCELISYSKHNSTKLPPCTQMFFNNNTYFQQTFKQFQAQTSQIEDCMTYLSELQKKYVGYQLFHYKEHACTWYLIAQKATAYFTPETDVYTTGTRIFKTIFGNIALILMAFSNIIFSVTTFITIFYMTVNYFDSRSTIMQQIFFGERKQLFSQITNLIQATLYIVVEHFFVSIILLELFNFSDFNMMISTFLSSMAFVPFFRPWFGALFFCIIRSLFIGNYVVNIAFILIYYYLSEKIFSSRFKNMKFHEIITNLSILFGIYQFGIAGIFYGPIIMILFRSVHRQLLRNQVYLTQE